MTTTTAEQAGQLPEQEPAEAYRWRWVVLFVILAAEVMDLIDSTVVNVAAPSIKAELGGTYSAVQWIAAGYTLAFAVMLITGARLGDLFGRRRMFIVGAAGFTIASAACALAQSPGQLIALRVLQGGFGALLIPQGFGVIKMIFPAKDLPKAFGLFGPVIGLSAVCGPILAGSLIDADLWGTGWRMIFLVNLPLGALAVAGALRFMPESRASNAKRLDVPGMLLVIAASLLLIYPLVQGRELGWPLWTYLMMVGSLPVFAVFVWYERRRVDSPLIEASLFTKRAFTAGLVVVTAFFCAMAGLMLTFGIFTQIGLGYSPLRAGLAMVPWAVGTVLGAILSGAVLGPKYGRPVIQAGLAVLGAGFVALVATVHQFGTAITSWQLVPAIAICGVGTGLVIAPLFNVILAGVSDDEVGTGSGVLNAVQQFGGAVGVAVLGTVFFNLVGADGDFAAAMQRTGWLAAGLMVAAFLLAFTLPRQARPEDH